MIRREMETIELSAVLETMSLTVELEMTISEAKLATMFLMVE